MIKAAPTKRPAPKREIRFIKRGEAGILVGRYPTEKVTMNIKIAMVRI